MRNLNYKHLHYFWIAAREGGVTAASRRLYLTPQTISGQISELEDQIGEALFTRTGRQLRLTEVGRMVFQYADEMFRLGTELSNVLSGRLPNAVRQFSIGIVDGISKLVAYRVLQPALNHNGGTHVVCHDGQQEELVAQLAFHKLDMVLADSPVPNNTSVKVFSHLLGESGITFFANRKQMNLDSKPFPSNLDGAPMLLPGAGTQLRRTLETWFEDEKIAPRIVGEIDDAALIKVFAEAGAGVVAAPTVIADQIERQYDLAPIGSTEAVREFYYAISAERRLKHPAVVAISDSAREKLFVNL